MLLKNLSQMNFQPTKINFLVYKSHLATILMSTILKRIWFFTQLKLQACAIFFNVFILNFEYTRLARLIFRFHFQFRRHVYCILTSFVRFLGLNCNLNRTFNEISLEFYIETSCKRSVSHRVRVLLTPETVVTMHVFISK